MGSSEDFSFLQEQGRVYFIILQVCPSYILIGFLLYVFGCRISMLVGPSLFTDGCSAVVIWFACQRRGKLRGLLLHHLIS